MQILIVADIHANLAALEAVLAAAPPVDAVWNLGDSIGYGPRPVDTLALLTTLPMQASLAGNHDLAAIGQLDLTTFNHWARAAARWTATQLRAADVAWLASLPSRTVAGGMTLAHGSPRHPVWEYVTDEATAAANFAAFETAVSWIGHSHLALAASLDERGRTKLRPFRDGETISLEHGRWLINPGSVGQPRDGDPRAAFAILDTDRALATSYRIPYDIARTQQEMTDVGLPPPLIERLALGV